MTYTYEGEVNARGYEDGHGRSFFSHGDEYIGQWRNGNVSDAEYPQPLACAATFAIATLTPIYLGKQDGQGTFKYADGTMHTGAYKDGCRNGSGTFRFADGAEHTGEYKNDCMCAGQSCPCSIRQLRAFPYCFVQARMGYLQIR